MELEYIKANGEYYYPQEAGVKNEYHTFGNYDVCIIKKLMFGKWQIDYYDSSVHYAKGNGYTVGSNAEDIPNQRLILYPSGIEEIRYIQ